MLDAVLDGGLTPSRGSAEALLHSRNPFSLNEHYYIVLCFERAGRIEKSYACHSCMDFDAAIGINLDCSEIYKIYAQGARKLECYREVELPNSLTLLSSAAVTVNSI